MIRVKVCMIFRLPGGYGWSNYDGFIALLTSCWPGICEINGIRVTGSFSRCWKSDISPPGNSPFSTFSSYYVHCFVSEKMCQFRNIELPLREASKNITVILEISALTS